LLVAYEMKDFKQFKYFLGTKMITLLLRKYVIDLLNLNKKSHDCLKDLCICQYNIKYNLYCK